jgi:hypothetical protein
LLSVSSPLRRTKCSSLSSGNRNAPEPKVDRLIVNSLISRAGAGVRVQFAGQHG